MNRTINVHSPLLDSHIATLYEFLVHLIFHFVIFGIIVHCAQGDVSACHIYSSTSPSSTHLYPLPSS